MTKAHNCCDSYLFVVRCTRIYISIRVLFKPHSERSGCAVESACSFHYQAALTSVANWRFISSLSLCQILDNPLTLLYCFMQIGLRAITIDNTPTSSLSLLKSF